MSPIELRSGTQILALTRIGKKRLLARILTKARKRLTRFDKKVCKFKEKDPG